MPKRPKICFIISRPNFGQIRGEGWTRVGTSELHQAVTSPSVLMDVVDGLAYVHHCLMSAPHCLSHNALDFKQIFKSVECAMINTFCIRSSVGSFAVFFIIAKWKPPVHLLTSHFSLHPTHLEDHLGKTMTPKVWSWVCRV